MTISSLGLLSAPVGSVDREVLLMKVQVHDCGFFRNSKSMLWLLGVGWEDFS